MPHRPSIPSAGLGTSLPANEVFPGLYSLNSCLNPLAPELPSNSCLSSYQLFNALRPLIREPNILALQGGNVSSISEYRKDLFATPGGMLRRSSVHAFSKHPLLGLAEDPVPSRRQPHRRENPVYIK
jgi:hypothetical protein